MIICGYNIESHVHIGRFCASFGYTSPKRAGAGRYAGVRGQRCSCTATVETILPVVRRSFGCDCVQDS